MTTTNRAQKYLEVCQSLGYAQWPIDHPNKSLAGKQVPHFLTFCSFIQIPIKVSKANNDGASVLSGQAQSGLIWFSVENMFPEQIDFCKNRSKRDVVLKSRQIGFSTLEVIRDLFFALCNPNSQVKILSHDSKVTTDLLGIIKNSYESLSEQFPELFPSMFSFSRRSKMAVNQKEFKLFNGSVIKVLTPNRIRGGKIDRLHLTEIAFWDNQEEIMAALEPACHADTEVVIESTPLMMGDYFYRFVQDTKLGKTGYKFHFWPWMAHPPNSSPSIIMDSETGEILSGEVNNPELLKDETERDIWEKSKSFGLALTWEQISFWRQKVAKMGLEKAKSEYATDPESCFASTGNMWLSGDERTWLDTLVKEPLFQGPGGSRIYQEPEPGVDYVLGADVGQGSGGDNSAIVVLRCDNLSVVATWNNNQIDAFEMVPLISELSELYNRAMICVEINDRGSAAVMKLNETGWAHNLYSGEKWKATKGPDGEPYRGAFHTNARTKPAMFNNLKAHIREQTLQGPMCEKLATELKFISGATLHAVNKYTKTTGNDNPGDNDDLVIALGIALLIWEELFSTSAISRYSQNPILYTGSRSGGKSEVYIKPDGSTKRLGTSNGIGGCEVFTSRQRRGVVSW